MDSDYSMIRRGSGMNNATTDCLRRTSADDRAEAAGLDDAWRDGRVTCDECDAALAAIQRREAEAVFTLAATALVANEDAFQDAAQAAAFAAQCVTNPANKAPLAQAAIALDAARSLVAVALEVAR